MDDSIAIVVSVFIGEKEEKLRAVSSVVAIAGKGLDGDRYSDGTGTFYKPDTPDREVTLIEIEALEALKRDYGIDLSPAEARRNILTRGISLNHLVGRAFSVGAVQFEGLRLCEPCGHLAALTSEKVRQALVHRGGLRSRVVVGGEIRAGDRIEVRKASGNRAKS
jgi:MOSC domain-containing protein YiiM